MERSIFIVLHVLRDERGEHRGLDELHSHKYTQIAYARPRPNLWHRANLGRELAIGPSAPDSARWAVRSLSLTGCHTMAPAPLSRHYAQDAGRDRQKLARALQVLAAEDDQLEVRPGAEPHGKSSAPPARRISKASSTA